MFAQLTTRNKIYLIAGLAGLFLILIAVLSVRSLGFNVASTNPEVSQLTTSTPFLKVTFNRDLSKDNVKVTSDHNIVQSTSVDGKTLTINISAPLPQNVRQKITISSITSTKGETMTNKTFSFIPTFVTDIEKLPEDQQKALNARDSDKPYSAGFIQFNGTPELQKRGLTAEQIGQFQNGMFNYFTSINKKIKTVDIDTASVRTDPYDPENPSTTFTMFFNVKLETGTSLSVRLDYKDFTKTQTRLYNFGTNDQIFDSGMLGN
jgi:hypothetical protein